MTDAPDATGEAFAEPATHERQSTARWIVIALVVVALVLLVAWARRNAPFDDRVPDPPDALPAVVIVDREPGGV